MDTQQIKSFVNDYVEEKRLELRELSDFIFNHPEVGFEEYESAAVQVEFLRKYGFDVTEKAGGMDTAFLGRFDNGEGPHISIFSEYDCLPGGLDHACGHNLIAAAAVGAGIAAKAAMEKYGIQGSVTVVGGPAEEGGGGKIKLLQAGCFDDMDAAMAVHPTSAVSRVAGGSNTSCKYTCEYFGKPAHAGNRPWEGVNAQDAALLFFNAMAYTRQMTEDGIRIRANIPEGMAGAIGSIVPYTRVVCSITAPSYRMLTDACTKVERCFEAGAVGTGCTFKVSKEMGYKNRIPNGVLGELFRANAEGLGEPMMEGMPADNGGEDMGDVSHLIPAINPHMTIFTDHKISGHTDLFREKVRTPQAEHMFMLCAKVMADTTLDLLLDPAKVEAAKAEQLSRMQAEYGDEYEKYMR
ncbi:MAG: M20/M25/M40 family metallo-hydrolase [Clostridia bacterium]|nr:M20/M25/M40 family metallo-hydrolase [Clostridia bacterium]